MDMPACLLESATSCCRNASSSLICAFSADSSSACLESVAGNVEAAIEALRIALEHQEQTVEWARDDPDFVFIRDDPRYRALVGLGDDGARDG